MYLSFMGARGYLTDGRSCVFNATVGVEPIEQFHSGLIEGLTSLEPSATVADVLNLLELSLGSALASGARLSLLYSASDPDDGEDWDEDLIDIYGEDYIFGFSGSQSFLRLDKSNEVINDVENMRSLISSLVSVNGIGSYVEIWGEEIFRLVLVGNPETENTSWQLLDEDDSELATGEDIGRELAERMILCINQ